MAKKMAVASVAILGGTLIVIGLEVGLTLTVLRSETESYRFAAEFAHLSGEGLVVQHDSRSFTLASHYRLRSSHAGPYANGEWPFRGRPPVVDPWMKTIAVLGDSCVFGIGLDPADTISHQLQQELADRGMGPSAVQVINYGVPGYSALQVRSLLEEVVFRESMPDLVIFYVAAWNDQSPAMGKNDVELRTFASRGAFSRTIRLPYIREVLSRGSPQEEPSPSHHRERVVEAWKQGRYIFGDRVPEESLEGELAELVATCRRNTAKTLFLAPAHPAETAREYPRTRRDATLVQAVAKRLEAVCLDAQALFSASGLTDDVLFTDFVHPSRFGVEVLRRPLGDQVVKLLGMGPRAHDDGSRGQRILGVQPEAVPAFGDVEIEIAMEAEMEWPIEATVGGGVLLDARLEFPYKLVGTIGSNRPGRHEVVLQSASGEVAWLPEAVRFEAVEAEIESESPLTVRVQSRPGDRVRLFVAERQGAPRWTMQGYCMLDPETVVPEELEATCGEDGAGYVSLEHLSGSGWVQALVLPRGLPEVFSTNARWTNVLAVHNN